MNLGSQMEAVWKGLGEHSIVRGDVTLGAPNELTEASTIPSVLTSALGSRCELAAVPAALHLRSAITDSNPLKT